LDGWDVRVATNDYIFVAILITVQIQKFLRGTFLRCGIKAILQMLLITEEASTNFYEFLQGCDVSLAKKLFNFGWIRNTIQIQEF